MSTDPLRLSPSQISAWCTCHYAWALQYVYMVPRPTSAILQLGSLLHRELENVVKCQLLGERYIPLEHEEALSAIREATKDAAEPIEPDEPDELAAGVKNVLQHVEQFRAGYLPHLQPAAVEEAWERKITDDDGNEIILYARGDLRDKRGFWVDYKLKSKIPTEAAALPAADQLELQLQVAVCPDTTDAMAHVFQKTGKRQVVIPMEFQKRFGNVDTLRSITDAVACAIARGIRDGNEAPTGLWSERWGRQVCYYCDYKKTGRCHF